MKMCTDCHETEATVNGYYCMSCKVKRNRVSRDRNKTRCECGNFKLKESSVCGDCRPGRPVTGRKSRFDSCSCGESKNVESLTCLDCYRLESQMQSTTVRGPRPTNGEAAIYLLRNSEGKVFYVGSTKSPHNRIKKHRQKYGLGTTMIIVKIVAAEKQWEEEVMAMVAYRDIVEIKSATPGRTS